MINVEEELIKEEGLVLHSYKDSLGYWTGGVGHLLDKDVGNISLEQAGKWLKEDITNARKDCAKVLKCFGELIQERQYVCISMMFNLGINRFKGFKKFILALENKDYELASIEMCDSKWARQVKSRALKLSKIMRLGYMI